MWIERISLRNWRAYEDVDFHFPVPDTRHNVVLIGATNDVGKTSLLEAVSVCLFGDEGAEHLVRCGAKTKYRSFLENAFRRQARESRRASVEVVFHMDKSVTLAVKRVLHFQTNGKFRSEEVIITHNGAPLEIPALDRRQDSTLR